MPYKDEEKNKEARVNYYLKYKGSEGFKKRNNENQKRLYQRMKDDPERWEKWKKQRREYYQRNKKRIIEYGINHFRFGGNKNIVFERDSDRCQLCSLKKSGKNLLIHHRDGRGRGSKNPNNSVENLIVLCRSCHAVVHKFVNIKNISLFRNLIDNLSH